MVLGQTLAPFFEEHLIEALILLVLSFNIGAYKILWDRTESNEDSIDEAKKELSKDIEEVEEEVEDVKKNQQGMMRTMYGSETDETDDGHIVDTQKEFEKVHERIDRTDKCRKREHEEVKGILLRLIDELDKEEEIDLDIDISDHKYPGDD